MTTWHDDPQDSLAWHERRLGLLTASIMGSLITPGGKPSKAQTRTMLMYALLGETFTGRPHVDIGHLEPVKRGTALQPEGTSWYAAMYDVEIEEVGLAVCDEGDVGASLDGIVVEDGERVGAWEMKAPGAKNHLYYMDGGTDVPAYRAQVQTQLLVTELPWSEFLSYHPKLPEMRVRIYPDDAWRGVLEDVLGQWREDYAATRERLEAKGCRARGLDPDWIAQWEIDQQLRETSI